MRVERISHHLPEQLSKRSPTDRTPRLERAPGDVLATSGGARRHPHLESLEPPMQRVDQQERDPKLGSPLQEFIAAIIVPALVNRWHREQSGRSVARDTTPNQKPMAVLDTSALP